MRKKFIFLFALAGFSCASANAAIIERFSGFNRVSADAVTLTATQTFTGANTFAGSAAFTPGKIFVSTYAAFIPYYVIPPTTFVGMTTQTWTVNLTTGSYVLTLVGSSSEMDYRWDSDAGGNYDVVKTWVDVNTGAPIVERSANGTSGKMTPGYGGSALSTTHTINIGGPMPKTTTQFHTTVWYSAETFARDISGSNVWKGTGYPTVLSVFTLDGGSFTGQIKLMKVSD